MNNPDQEILITDLFPPPSSGRELRKARRGREAGRPLLLRAITLVLLAWFATAMSIRKCILRCNCAPRGGVPGCTMWLERAWLVFSLRHDDRIGTDGDFFRLLDYPSHLRRQAIAVVFVSSAQ